MGKFITILLLAFSLNSNAQLIGEIRLMNQLHVSLSKENDKNVLMYRDEKFTKIIDFKTILLTEQESETIYNLVTTKKEGKDVLTLESGESITIEYRKSYVSIFHQEKSGVVGLLRLNNRQIKKLWAKENT